MLATLKSEFKKLLTIRSTYIITMLVLLLVAFLSIYVFGYQQSARPATSADMLQDSIYTMLGVFVTFGAIIAILLVAHEYRYGTINYTLTAARGRLRVLGAKTIVMLTYATIIGASVALIAYFGTKLGVHLKGDELVTQNLPILELLWRFTAYTWGYILAGLIIALLVRGVVGAIVVFFVTPIAEQMLSLLLKDNADFLPFRSLDAIASTSFAGIPTSGLTNLTALGVFTIYIVVAGGIAALLFVRRDAS